MDVLPEIDQLAWDDWNPRYIAKHGLTQKDVEAVITGPAVTRATYKHRFLVLGPGPSGQILAVVIGPDPDDPDSSYTFSARPASRQERRYYHQHQGDTAP